MSVSPGLCVPASVNASSAVMITAISTFSFFLPLFFLLLVSAVPCLFHVWFLLVYSNRQPDEAEDVIFPPHTQTYKHYGTPTHTHTVLKRETCLPGFIPGWHRRSFSFFPIVIFFSPFFFLSVCVCWAIRFSHGTVVVFASRNRLEKLSLFFLPYVFFVKNFVGCCCSATFKGT